MSQETEKEIKNIKSDLAEVKKAINHGTSLDVELNSNIKHIMESIKEIKQTIDNHDNIYVKKGEFEIMQNNQDKEIRKLQDTNVWVWRTVGGAILIGLLGLLLNPPI